jgi:hypothetical protein
MTQHDFLKPALTGLAKLQIELDKKGGPSEDGQLFEQILSLQDGILQSFGLPISPDNEKLIWFSQLPTDDEVNERVKQLHKTATAYLLSNAQPELQTLREAQEKQQDPFYVLPELKVKTHSYTLFVYNKILLERKDNLENILHDLKFTSHYPDILDALGQIEQGTLDNEPEVAEFLEKIGVRYLQQYYMHNSNLLSDDDY